MASIEEELEPYHDENNNNNVYDIIEIHYVWISHGESVSASNQKYAPPIPREFDNKLYAYAPYDTYLFPTHEMIKSLFDQSKGINYNGPELRNQIILNDFRNSLKSADIKPLNKNREKQILRPLHFASGNANDELSKYIGLYRLVSYSKKYLLSEQIMDVNGMIKKHENKGGATILYDDIFRYIKKDIDRNISLIQKSYVNAALQPNIQIDGKKRGYIPCRIFKNLSYGRLCGTNSKYVNSLFYDNLPFSESTSELFYNIENSEKNIKLDTIEFLYNFIKDKHTYVNRAKNIIKAFSA